jgi:hypothetical protein
LPTPCGCYFWDICILQTGLFCSPEAYTIYWVYGPDHSGLPIVKWRCVSDSTFLRTRNYVSSLMTALHLNCRKSWATSPSCTLPLDQSPSWIYWLGAPAIEQPFLEDVLPAVPSLRCSDMMEQHWHGAVVLALWGLNLPCCF